MNKSARAIAIIVLVVIIGIVVGVKMSSSKNSTPLAQQPPTTTSVSTTTTTPTTSTTGATTPITTTTPPVKTTPTQAPGTYTMAQVASHSSGSSCWTTINGSVYDVTSWISQHPGGSAAILSLCGTDGSAAFNDQHGGQRRPEAELASFKIGTLAN